MKTVVDVDAIPSSIFEGRFLSPVTVSLLIVLSMDRVAVGRIAVVEFEGFCVGQVDALARCSDRPPREIGTTATCGRVGTD